MANRDFSPGARHLVGHSDRPLDRLEQDSLGLGRYAQGLSEFIRHCDTPFTVAVQGDWGTGKTSLMHMVKGLLAPAEPPAAQPRIETVWFQTWQYSQFGSMAALPVSLLATLLECLSGDPGRFEQAKQVMGRLVKPLAGAALRIGTMGASELEDFEGVLAQQSVDSARNANQLKEEIADLVQRRLKAGADRIVIFIDDLDRIKPAIAVEILETIKLFVDWPGCVFVLALDYGVVSRGLKDKFGVGEQDLGRSFFDKIIQLPFTVPVARYTVDKYIDGLFRDMALPMGKGDGELFADLVRWSVSVNPRGIKRVFNSLQLLITMEKARGDRLAIRILFAVLCIQIGYEGVYNWLLNKAQQLEESDLLAMSAAGDDSRDPDLAAAFSNIPEARRDDFAKFVKAFFESIQNPDARSSGIDSAELDRIRSTLTLSRVTSLHTKPSAASSSANDPEFRRRNQQLMVKVREELEQLLASDIQLTGKNFWMNTGHQTSIVSLKRHVTADGSLNLVLDHGEHEVMLHVQGGKEGALRANAIALRDVLQPIADPYEESDDGPLLYRRRISSETSIEDRESLLLGEVKDRYLQAQQVLKDRLWR